MSYPSMVVDGLRDVFLDIDMQALPPRMVRSGDGDAARLHGCGKNPRNVFGSLRSLGQAIPPGLRERVRTAFQGLTVIPSVTSQDEFTVLVGGTKVTFLRYPFPVLGKLATAGGVQLLNVKEIAATKPPYSSSVKASRQRLP